MKPSSVYFVLAAIYVAPHASESVAVVLAAVFTVVAVVLLFTESE